MATSFTLGSIAALYESTVLMGALPFGGWLLGTFLGCAYLVFAVAVVAAVAGKAESVLVTAVVSIGVLLLLPLIGIAPQIGEWLPSYLVGAIDSLVRGGEFNEYWRALGVTLLLTALSLWLAVRFAQQRELCLDRGPNAVGSVEPRVLAMAADPACQDEILAVDHAVAQSNAEPTHAVAIARGAVEMERVHLGRGGKGFALPPHPLNRSQKARGLARSGVLRRPGISRAFGCGNTLQVNTLG